MTFQKVLKKAPPNINATIPLPAPHRTENAIGSKPLFVSVHMQMGNEREKGRAWEMRREGGRGNESDKEREGGRVGGREGGREGREGREGGRERGEQELEREGGRGERGEERREIGS